MKIAPSWPHHWVRACALAVVLGVPGTAQGDNSPKPVIVVSVTPGDPELDANAVRDAIARELGADAVAPDDPRAGQSRGTVVLGVDRDGRKLAVEYTARSVPLRREVELPSDPKKVMRAAVALAGNLARDEGSELAAELRRKHPPPIAVGVLPPPSHPEATPDVETGPQAPDDARLASTLDYFAERDRRARLAVSWTALGAGFAFLAVGVYANTQGDVPWMIGGYGGAGVLALSSLVGFASASSFEDLADYHKRGAGPEATEQEWVRRASSERAVRHASGWIGVVGGCAGATAVLIWHATEGRSSPARSFDGMEAAILGLDAFDVLMGVFVLSTEGPLESALHAYERAAGRSLGPSGAVLGHLQVGVTPRGVSAGFSAAF
jgi:hypothetical protein